ncbi:hypothetical protein WN943_009814 [Citrus x changshan-huyou]
MTTCGLGRLDIDDVVCDTAVDPGAEELKAANEVWKYQRDFAFVEYVTKQEAQNALEALSNTHLYGRHLVLERAKEGESLEELRARTAAQFTDEVNGFQNSIKFSKKRKHMTIFDEGRMKFERIAE